ncbi:MAG: MetQ/NlpA family ABC transporter substrate-binding protein [Tissierellia bacterium]|nr:MetQ/NlpA family ABC transporter substrate-binding protein [Tissierellia bacterium]
MKKALALIILLVALVGCSSLKGETDTIKIGITPVPNAEILEFIKEDIEAKGYKLDIIEFTDYVLPNLALDEGDLDINLFQHKPYLNNFNAERGTKVVAVADIYIAPIAIYSSKLSSLDELEDGALVVIPGDATNGGRSLVLLEGAGLIKLKEGLGENATPLDIVENPKNLKFKELEAAQIPNVLDDADIAAINVNFALSSGLDPRESLLREAGQGNPYANVLAVREGDEDKDYVKVLIEVLQSDKVRDFLNDGLEGAVLAAF